MIILDLGSPELTPINAGFTCAALLGVNSGLETTSGQSFIYLILMLFRQVKQGQKAVTAAPVAIAK